jgi:lysophospholipase L1-like esterase
VPVPTVLCMRLLRMGRGRWLPVAAACVLLLGLGVVIAVSADERPPAAAVADTPSLSAARTAGAATQAARESRSAERSSVERRSSAPETSSSSPSSSAAPTSAAGSSSPAGRHVVTFLGDSWTVGSGSEQQQGYAVLAGEELGWGYHVLGVGGSGYLQPGAGGPFADRVAAAAETAADVVVVQGSLNDQRSDLQALGPAALDTLSRLRAAVAPGTAVLVIGAPYTPGTDRAAIDAINAAVGGAAASLGLRFVDPATENWTDPADPSLWADADHPNDAGHRLIADHVAELLRETVED